MIELNSLIIPSAKLVPKELQSLGKIPSVIYPINDEIVFDFILRQYEECMDSIKIIGCERVDLIEEKLKTYSQNIEIKHIKKISDLGYTVYEGIKKINNPIIINFGDTIVDENILNKKDDFYFYSNDYLSSEWTFFEEKNGVITKIIDKNCPDVPGKGKVFIGVFKINDTAFFRKCLKNNLLKKDGIDSFYLALREYSNKNKIVGYETNNWFDIGHMDKYYNSKLEVKAREFNHITIDKNRGILTKTSDDVDKFIGEIKWYLKLPRDLEYSRPRIFDYSLSYSNPSVDMEYYSYHTLHELYLYGDLSYQQWEGIFNQIKFICDDYCRYKVSDSNIICSVEDIYLNKTIQRLNKLRDDDRFKAFFINEITLNDKKYKCLDEIIELLKLFIPKELYDISEFNIIHGDLCFSNIMTDNNFSFIKVIDPRGKFGNYDIYGDERYEIAKLFHSVDGKYDYIIKDLFEITIDENEINYRINQKSCKYDLFGLLLKVFDEKIKGNFRQIKLIESLLFLSMIPLHNESLSHQYAMLATGLILLDEVLDIKVERVGDC